MAMPLACEREQQEGELEGEGECGVEIQRGECVEVAVEGKLGLEDLEEEEEEGVEENDEEEEVEEETKEEDYEVEEEDDDDDDDEDEEEVFSSGRGESEEGDDKEEEVSSRVRVLFKFKRNPPSVIVKYNEDGEQVEFERHDTSDQTESDSDDEDDVEEEEDEVEAGRVFPRSHRHPWHWTHRSPTEFPAEFSPSELSPAEILENVTARNGVGAIGVRSPGSEISEGLYVVNDHDYYVQIAIAFPEVEEHRVNANRSTMIKLMAQSARKMELPPCGLYLAVLLLDFYWNHDRSQGRRMDSVQLHVLAYTCLYIASNRFRDPGLARTPDEFCKWVGVAEGSVKGCMIIRQLEAFEKLLRPENVSSVTCQFLWHQLKRFSNRMFRPELHMSDFIRDLEQTDYGIANFNPPAAVKAAHAVYATHMLMAAKLNDPTKFEDPAGAMKRMLLLASRSGGIKRGDMSMENAVSNMNKRAKIISLAKIAVL